MGEVRLIAASVMARVLTGGLGALVITLVLHAMEVYQQKITALHVADLDILHARFVMGRKLLHVRNAEVMGRSGAQLVVEEEK